MEDNKIEIYQTEDGQTRIDVRLENDTVWLTANQMAVLFDRDEKTIRKHINNVFSEGELDKLINTHFLRVDGVKQPVATYNLDVIISVGYRVHSKRGTDFRIWARQIIKDYLIKGYAVNQRIHSEQIAELRQLVRMLGRTIQSQPLLSTDETIALFDVVTDYTYALDTLDNYDYERLKVAKTTQEDKFHATYDNAMEAINSLRQKFGGSTLFGNKRIAATLFLWFLNNNGILYRTDGSKRIADNTLVALTLMIAESRTEEKDVMVKVVVNLINQDN